LSHAGDLAAHASRDCQRAALFLTWQHAQTPAGNTQTQVATVALIRAAGRTSDQGLWIAIACLALVISSGQDRIAWLEKARQSRLWQRYRKRKINWVTRQVRYWWIS